MALNIGDRLGHYDVTAKIGEGGMGEVYRAKDTKLDRDVALKVLPEAFTSDPDRVSRFEREAKVLASLNHPNIGGIHGLEESDGIKALVLELVQGSTLADRISKGPIPVEEALPMATQIAEALEAAHEAGAIHRDLKPANIKVKDDGTVKVLDFGLAKALGGDAKSDPSESPTLTAAATKQGVILGTAAYMSPEQARGKPVDKRADVWALGCILYEMLTGQTPFAGDSVTETLAAVLDRQPDWGALPAETPPGVITLLHRCLAKDPGQRLHDVADARLEIADPRHAPGMRQSDVAAPPGLWQRRVPAALGTALLVLLGGLVVWRGLGLGDTAGPMPRRFKVTLPASDDILAPWLNALAVSPDGRTLVYRANRDGIGQLFRRPIDEFDATPIPGPSDIRDLRFRKR